MKEAWNKVWRETPIAMTCSILALVISTPTLVIKLAG